MNALAWRALLGFFVMSISGVAAETAVYLGGDYRENFDSLAAPPWRNNTTLPGWFAYQRADGAAIYCDRADGEWVTIDSTSYRISDGQTGEELLNFGRSSNRALGVRTVSGDLAFALVLRNDTTNIFACLTLEYYGEQWQQNSSLTSRSDVVFAYGVFPTFIESAHPPGQRVNPCTIVPHEVNEPDGFNVGYLPAPSLNITAFIYGSEQFPLNGDLPRNRRRKISTFPLNWHPATFLVLRWFADNRCSAISQMLAVDDLRLRAIPVGAVEFTQTHLLSTGGQVQIILCGTAGEAYEIETSDDLNSWEREFTVTNTTGTVEFSVPAEHRRQFFRAVKVLDNASHEQ
jgi:hypothetical protein